jgi:hypothetical protein
LVVKHQYLMKTLLSKNHYDILESKLHSTLYLFEYVFWVTQFLSKIFLPFKIRIDRYERFSESFP